jgi:sugar phosphate permease
MLRHIEINMKTFLLTILGGLASGYAAYYIIRASFNVLLLLFNHELTTTQRIFVIENGYLAFVAGMVVGMVLFWRVFRR